MVRHIRCMEKQKKVCLFICHLERHLPLDKRVIFAAHINTQSQIVIIGALLTTIRYMIELKVVHDYVFFYIEELSA